MDEELNCNSIDVACVFEFNLEFMEYDFWNISVLNVKYFQMLY